MSRPDLTGLSGILPGRLRLPLLFVAALIAGIVLDRAVLRPSAPPPAPAARHIAAPSGVVTLTPERARAAGIRVQPAAAGSLAGRIMAQATVAATPDGAAVIGARADGTVVSIRKRLGDTVRAGESLGVIQSREAARLSEDHSAAQTKLAHAQHEHERQSRLLKDGATSHHEFDEAQTALRIAEAEMARARAAGRASGLSGDGISFNIVSPVSGRITAAPAVLGSYVVAGAELFRVADPAKLEVHAAVPAAEAGRIRTGDAAEITLAGVGGVGGSVTARVRAFTPDVDRLSRAATVILVPDREAGLQPGQLVSARILLARGASESGVLVPSESLQKIGGEDMVFVRTPEGYRARAVTIGSESGGLTELSAGLKPGEEIAVAGAFLLKSELQKQEGQ